MGHEAPTDAPDLALRVAETASEEALRRGEFHLVAKPVTDPAGRSYVVVGTLHRPPRPVDLLEPEGPVAASQLAGRCSSVYWVFSSPRSHLSSPWAPCARAASGSAQADLSARVGGRVVRRRDEIGQLAREFDTMAEQLEGLVGSQRRLLRDVSHEVRSPLARLRVALELARDQGETAADENFDRMEREAERIDDLIGQLLLLERLAAGEPDGEKQTFALSDLLGEVVDDASFEASVREIGVAVKTVGATASIRGFYRLLRDRITFSRRTPIRHAPALRPP